MFFELLSLGTGEHKSSLALPEVGQVGGGVLLDDDGLTLGAHVTLDIISQPHSQLFPRLLG